MHVILAFFHAQPSFICDSLNTCQARLRFPHQMVGRPDGAGIRNWEETTCTASAGSVWSPTTGSIQSASRDPENELHPILFPLYPRSLHVACPVGRFVYPFQSKLQWWVRGRPAHLIAAIERDRSLAAGPYKGEIATGLVRIRRWMVVRVVMLIGLSMGVVSSILSILLRSIPRMAEVQAGLGLLVQISTALAGLFTLGYLLSNRTLSQLEIDVLLLLQLSRTDKRQ